MKKETIDKYLELLTTAKSFRELADELGVDGSRVRKNLKKMEKDGLIRSYKVGNMGKIVYIRRIGDGDWKDWL